jgi:hypothetical protein
MTTKHQCVQHRPIKHLEQAIQRAKQQSERTGEDIVHWYCDYCGNFHTGHNKINKLNAK